MERFYTPQEIATLYSVHFRTVYNWIASGKLRAVKVGRFIRIPESSLKKLEQKV